jgi:F-type H+-transporting ATPase subunit delta
MDFRGASAESLAALAELVDKAKANQLATLGAELFQVSNLLRSEPGLRRMATDASVGAEAKQKLINGIFSGRVAAPTLGVLTAASGRRWTSPGDLPRAMERLSEIAHAKSSKNLNLVATELFSFAQVVSADNNLRDALANPGRTAADRAGLIKTLLDGKALPATVALAQQSVLGSYRTVSAALAEYQRVVAAVQRQGVATVRVARPLSADHTKRLESALATRYGHPVHLNVVVDPQVVGGLSVAVGDDVIDGTVSTRLATAGRKIAG